MKNLFIPLFILMSAVVYGQNRLEGNYKLIAIQNKTTNAVDSTRQERGLIITFKTDTTLTFRLSINNCWGSYHLGKDRINIKPGACTEICCDSKLADKFYKILGEVDRFEIEEVRLIIENLYWVLYFERTP
jgi:hypothetical protein